LINIDINTVNDRDAVPGTDWAIGVGLMECVRWGRDSPTERGNFEGCLAHSKTLTVSVVVFAAQISFDIPGKQK